MPIKLVSLNLIRHDTRQQPAPACRPASRANQKLHPKGYINVRTRFSSVCTFHEMYVAICTLNIACINMYIHVCTLYVHVCTMQNMYVNVLTCTYMSEPCTYMFVAFIVHTMYIPCTYMFMIFHFCTYHVYTCIYIS